MEKRILIFLFSIFIFETLSYLVPECHEYCESCDSVYFTCITCKSETVGIQQAGSDCICLTSSSFYEITNENSELECLRNLTPFQFSNFSKHVQKAAKPVMVKTRLIVKAVQIVSLWILLFLSQFAGSVTNTVISAQKVIIHIALNAWEKLLE